MKSFMLMTLLISAGHGAMAATSVAPDEHQADADQSAVTSHAAVCVMPAATQLAMLRHEVERDLTPDSRAVAHIHTEGTLPHQGIRDQSIAAEKDWRLMRALAQLWQAEHQPQDVQALSQLLNDWAKVYQPDFNPIDETQLDAYIDAYAIAHTALDPATQENARRFIRVLGEGYVRQMEDDVHPGDGRWVNNWNSHRIKLAALAAAALDDKGLWSRVRKLFITHLGHNIRSDGVTVDFEQRDALHYVVYDLEPLVRAAQAARWYDNEDWLTLKGSSGGSVAAALDWLVPYANGQKTHKEFVHSRVRFDAERNAAGVKGFSGVWEPEKSAHLYAMAAALDVRYRQLAQQLRPDDHAVPICWAD